MQRKIFIYLIILFQLAIIGVMIGRSMRPLLTGWEIQLRVQAQDPRDIFRGNYSTLQYAYSTLNLDSIPNDLPGKNLRYGDRLYLELAQKGNFYEPAGLWLSRPDKKPIMQVITAYHYGRTISLTGGIESYFSDPEKAKALDKKLMETRGSDSVIVFARVMVAPDGEARIKALEYNSR